MTNGDHLESFLAKFELTSLLAIFQFWSTFWLKWTKMSPDIGTIWNHFKQSSNRLYFWQFSNFGQFLAKMEEKIT